MSLVHSNSANWQWRPSYVSITLIFWILNKKKRSIWKCECCLRKNLLKVLRNRTVALDNPNGLQWRRMWFINHGYDFQISGCFLLRPCSCSFVVQTSSWNTLCKRVLLPRSARWIIKTCEYPFSKLVNLAFAWINILGYFLWSWDWFQRSSVRSFRPN